MSLRCNSRIGVAVLLRRRANRFVLGVTGSAGASGAGELSVPAWLKSWIGMAGGVARVAACVAGGAVRWAAHLSPSRQK